MWNPEQRQILTLTVSGRVHKLDPMPLVRRYRAELQRVGDKAFAEGLRQMLGGEETPGVADLIMPVIKATLQWPAFDDDPENGYTQSEMLIAFTQFVEWLVDSKKKDETLPSSAGSDGASDATQTTPSTVPSSYAETLSSPEEPGKQQPASA